MPPKEATKRTPAKASPNGKPEQNTLAEAMAYEDEIRNQAELSWAGEGDLETELDASLFRELRSLLRKPIPSGYIEHVGQVTGKPYESTGVKSVQVQIDRLDNVLGATNWGYEATYSDDGKLCHVRAWVGPKDKPLFERDSWGGVDRGSTQGNVRKGAFTNAAKLAFARIGPGWEVYVGAGDFDPDTDKPAAEAQAKADKPEPESKLDDERIQALKEILTDIKPELVAAKLRGFGVDKIEDLTYEQGLKLFTWAQKQGGDDV